MIGCIILTDIFCFDEEDWIPAPVSFHRSIAQGKRYYTEGPRARIYFLRCRIGCGRLQYIRIPPNDTGRLSLSIGSGKAHFVWS